MTGREITRPDLPLAPLSPRELEVLLYASHGLTVEMIAEVLGMSYENVRDRLKMLHVKLQAKNRAHLIANAFRAGIVD